MNKLILYHWNYSTIEFPAICKSKFTKDFSYGFYCTTDQQQAEIFASKFITPVVNVYELNDIVSLNIKTFSDYYDEWIDFVMSCRNGSLHTYDVVIGPIADDTIYDYIDSYMLGQMNNQKFYDLMNSKYPANQISIHTIKALNSINFIKSYTLPRKD